MAKVHPDPEVRVAASEAEERLDKWATDLTFRRPVYEALITYADSEGAAALEGTSRRLLDHWLRDFRRAGHELDDASRTELQRLQNRLVELPVDSSAISPNGRRAGAGAFPLDGLPDSYLDGMKTTEDGRYRVTMDYPDYVPFMQQATDRDTRRDLQHRTWNRATEANRPLLEEAVAIRLDIDRLLGTRPGLCHGGQDGGAARGGREVLRLHRSRAHRQGGRRTGRPHRPAPAGPLRRAGRGVGLELPRRPATPPRPRHRPERGRRLLPARHRGGRHVRPHRRRVRVGLPHRGRGGGVASRRHPL